SSFLICPAFSFPKLELAKLKNRRTEEQTNESYRFIDEEESKQELNHRGRKNDVHEGRAFVFQAVSSVSIRGSAWSHDRRPHLFSAALRILVLVFQDIQFL
ncbi:hypothetical protein LINGRAHAP2_LOCUS34083, partial [Linum grandiflorum]